MLIVGGDERNLSRMRLITMERINDVVVVLVVVQFYVNNLCYILPPWLTINEIR